MGKKKKVIIILVIVLILGAVVASYFLFGASQDKNLNTNASNLVRRFIDGVFVEKGQENLYPIAISIENLVTVRPQSGLIKANLVYEALAEGGITRFLAIYAGGENVEEIGPVRSARTYYLDWAEEYKALYAHVGGSPDSLSKIADYDIINLDQIRGDHSYFWRDSSQSAPHNLYTSMELLTYALRDREAPEKGDYKPWLFKEDLELNQRISEEKSIVIDFSTFNYQVEYKYDKESNSYLRFNGGEAHLDKASQEQIKAKNVVVQYVSTHLMDQSRLEMETIGEGKALIFQDGKTIEGTWEKEARGERTKFYNQDKEEIRFDAGQTWIEVLPTDREVIY